MLMALEQFHPPLAPNLPALLHETIVATATALKYAENFIATREKRVGTNPAYRS
jgi:hypothetical protein